MVRHLHSRLMVWVLLLIFSPAWGAFAISASSSLDSFNYDLDNVHLKLEKLDARLRLSPSPDNQFTVERLHARRLIITTRATAKKTGDSTLPARINLPFPVTIQQASIAEVIIVSDGKQFTLSNVRLAFEGDTGSLRIKNLQADTAWGKADGTLTLGTANPFAVSGTLGLEKTDGQLPYGMQARLSGNLKTLVFESTAHLARPDSLPSVLRLSDGLPANPAARVMAKGRIGLADDKYPLTLEASIDDLRPELLGNYPVARLNFDIQLKGNLSPQPDVQMQLASRDSQWRSQAFSGSGKLQISGNDIRDIDMQAGIAGNLLEIKGDMDKTSRRLEWHADLPDISAIAPQFSGWAQARGIIAGDVGNPMLDITLAGKNLALPGNFKLAALDGQASFMAGQDGKVAGEFNASGLQLGNSPPFDSHLLLQGMQSNHQLQLSARRANMQLQSILQGKLVSGSWQGELRNMEYQGENRIVLQAPAQLHASRHDASLKNAVLQLEHGLAFIDVLTVDTNGFSSQGHLEKVALTDIPPELFAMPSRLQGKPVFSANWDIHADQALNGTISLWHESGDMLVNAADGTAIPLGLTEAEAKATFSNNRVNLSAWLDGQQAGSMQASMTTSVTRTAQGFALMADSPLTFNGTARIKTLSWLPLPQSLADAGIDGEISAAVQAEGTLGKPNLRGNLTGNRLQLSMPSEGVTFRDGVLEASFDNDRLLIKHASWKGGEGHLQASGRLILKNRQPQIDLDWSADKFTAISRTDRLLTLSGTGKTVLTHDLLTISGHFTVDKGLVELASESTPALGNDVMILGRTDTRNDESALKILFHTLDIDLGDQFSLRGYGLDTELTGKLALTGLAQFHPHTEGSISVSRGTYMAYGQTLQIERGVLTFSGPVDNPGLNIRAMRNSKPVNAGVEITGTAFQPVTQLVSDPSVPDTEKLSWLVLGHGMDQAGKNEFSILSLAAGALFSHGQSVPLQTQIARAAGLDELSFTGSDAESAAITFGKRLGSRLYLSYEKSISGLLDVARLTFNITPRWSLRAEAGTESAVDVLYTFSFR